MSVPMTGNRAGAETMEANLKVGEQMNTSMRSRAHSQEMFSGQVFVPGRTERVGTADPDQRLSD